MLFFFCCKSIDHIELLMSHVQAFFRIDYVRKSSTYLERQWKQTWWINFRFAFDHPLNNYSILLLYGDELSTIKPFEK